MAVEDDHSPQEDLTSRAPSLEDLVQLCRELNSREARYVIIGGFAIQAAGYDRRTMDVDLLIETGVENETRVFAALATLPDAAALELKPGEVEEYGVIRVADEIMVDLMKSAQEIDYAAACEGIVYKEISGVQIPFASPELLRTMKTGTHREKDALDLVFLHRILSDGS